MILKHSAVIVKCHRVTVCVLHMEIGFMHGHFKISSYMIVV